MSDASNDEVKSAGADLSGRQLGDYQLLRRLGRGAMAEVYLAEQKSLSRQVAVKVLKKELATDDIYVQRFQREARAAGALVHANIVQIHEVGCIDGVYFIAQEYVEGANLKQWLSRHGPLDLRLGLIIMRQVAAALAKAADQGIVHRDIKPENIMLTSSGEVKVADFGLARMSRADSTDLTQVGITLGTPLYMSPEQVEGKPLDPRSDIYSFGVTCYHVLSGSTPFAGDTALNVALQHLKKRAEPLENLRPDLPPALARVVHKMLAKKPADRYQSARELLKELYRLQVEHLEDDWPEEELPGLETAGVEFANTSLDSTTQELSVLMKTTAYRKPGRRLWLLQAAGVGVMFLAGAAAAYYTTSETPLLAESQGESASVPRRENASLQFWYANLENTEEAWLSVERHFPDNDFWVQRSRQQLARYYLIHGRNDKAMEIFDEFANLGGPDAALTAFGLAGQFAVLAMEENFREAAPKLDLLQPYMNGLSSSPYMELLFRQTLQNLWKRGHLAPGQQWQEWLDEQFSEEETDADPP